MEGFQWDGGICYVAWPSDINRDDYLKDCYMNSQISVWMNDGSLVNRVIIDNDSLNWITFPQKTTQRGSAVIFIKESQTNQLIIVGVVNRIDQLGQLKENCFSLGRTFKNKVVKINGNVDDGTLSIMVQTKEKQGKVNIVLDNDSDDCLFSVSVSGSVDLEATHKISVNSNEEVVISTQTMGNKANPSFIKVEESEAVVGSRRVIINSNEVSIEHYDGQCIKINENGIVIYGKNQPITIANDSSSVKIKGGKIQIKGRNITVGGSFPVLYSKIPEATAIGNVSQIGVSRKVKVG